MNDFDKLLLLKLATGIYFTDSSEFFSTLHRQFGTEKCSIGELEAFLSESIDFPKLPIRTTFEHEVAIEVPSLDEIEEEQEQEKLKEKEKAKEKEQEQVKEKEKEAASRSTSPLQKTHLTASSSTSSASSKATSRPISPSATATITVKTPSGRTLRSTVPVAPSEPRRLRSSSRQNE